MSEEIQQTLLTLGLFVCGALAGLLSRWGPLSGWAALTFPLVLTPAGIALTLLFCWGHPLTLLGPSILFISPPFCVGYAFHASRHAQAKSAARVGLVLAGVELLVLVTLMVIGAAAAGMG